jgi:predicted house-cleaning noncanonical NTP pyrophosphatase (MazG superfamily)
MAAKPQRKKTRKKKLIRDFYQDRIPPDEWERLPKGGKQHLRYLKAKLQEEVDELHASDYLDIEEYADIIEVLKCLAFFLNVDWNDVHQARIDKVASKGKFLDGILLLNTPTETKS